MKGRNSIKHGFFRAIYGGTLRSSENTHFCTPAEPIGTEMAHVAALGATQSAPDAYKSVSRTPWIGWTRKERLKCVFVCISAWWELVYWKRFGISGPKEIRHVDGCVECLGEFISSLLRLWKEAGVCVSIRPHVHVYVNDALDGRYVPENIVYRDDSNVTRLRAGYVYTVHASKGTVRSLWYIV